MYCFAPSWVRPVISDLCLSGWYIRASLFLFALTCENVASTPKSNTLSDPSKCVPPAPAGSSWSRFRGDRTFSFVLVFLGGDVFDAGLSPIYEIPTLTLSTIFLLLDWLCAVPPWWRLESPLFILRWRLCQFHSENQQKGEFSDYDDDEEMNKGDLKEMCNGRAAK